MVVSCNLPNSSQNLMTARITWATQIEHLWQIRSLLRCAVHNAQKNVSTYSCFSFAFFSDCATRQEIRHCDLWLLAISASVAVSFLGRGVLENVTTEDLRHHQEQFVMWEAMAETQEAETDALSTEIALFKRKDTDIHLLKQMIERRYEDVPARTIENVHTQTQTLV